MSAQHRLTQNLGAIGARLEPNRFARVHRSVIVRIGAVTRLEPWTHGDAILSLIDGSTVVLSRTFRPSFVRSFMQVDEPQPPVLSRGMPRWPLLALAALAGACSSDPTPIDLADHALASVDPFIGSGGLGFAVGSIPPGPTHPFGFAKPGPDTSAGGGGAVGFAHCAGYWFEDDEIRAFSQIHLSGTGVPDLGVLAIMPVTAVPAGPMSPDAYRAHFDHRKENAEVGRYTVTLDPSNIRVDISATPHTAIYRIDYPAVGGQLVIDLAHGLGGGTTIDSDLTIDPASREVSGWLHHKGGMSGGYGGFRLFFLMRFDGEVTSTETFTGVTRFPGARTATGAEAGAIVSFAGTQSLGVQIGLSFVDVETARANLTAEQSFDIEKAVADTKAAWRPLLGKIAIEGASDEERRTFYSSLYRVHHMPTSLTEAGGKYRGIDGMVHTADGWNYYSDFSLWDTFRTLHPLFTLIAPDYQRDFSRSIVAMTVAGGMVPRWPLATGETWTMIGSHGESAVVDGWVKGVRDFDVDAFWSRVWPAVNGTSTFLGQTRSSRECVESWTTRNYCAVGVDGGRTVSRTLENSYNDWLLARFAEGLGKTTEAAQLDARTRGWTHIFDPSVGFMRGKDGSGQFVAEFAEDIFSDEYTEGNARQWLPYVPHDLPELAKRMGGDDKLVEKMSAIFQGAADSEKTFLPDAFYWHGNEPDIHAAYVFSEVGRPDLTQKWVKWVLDERYDATPAGLDGNDDAGTLSAWYVFSALGIYPKVGTTTYYLGSPRYVRSQIMLGENTVTIEAVEANATITEAFWNGSKLPGLTIDHSQLIQGGLLELK